MRKLLPFILMLMTISCQMKKEPVDLLIKDATVYTVDKDFSKVESIVVNKGRIIATGNADILIEKYEPAETISMDGKFIYPGWIDAHCHFTGYGLSLNQVNLMGTKSVSEIIDRCKIFAKEHPGKWITGRGWDQNDWDTKEFPNKSMLDEFFPDTPVLLRRIDGHAGWANSRALEIAGVRASSIIDGGSVRISNNEADGILIDNAIELVAKVIPETGTEEIITGLLHAQKNCFAVGLTSVTDAGLSTTVVQIIDSLQKSGTLKMRINAWLDPSESNYKCYVEKGILQNDYLRVGTIKTYADGALGSRGAKMLEDYSDDPGNSGLFVSSQEELRAHCKKAFGNGYQMAIHCIGDEANREVLKIYSEVLEKDNDCRWRIEHSQIIHPDDFSSFGEYNIVPSIQTTHATSDMYWAEKRIGPERIKGAYSYQTLLQENGWIPNGSDFPVEHINPIYGFYAAFSRKDKDGFPAEGFRIEEALSRKEALKAMTIWAAKAAFEENLKGSIESGKLADFTVTDIDIMAIPENELPTLKVYQTWSGGKVVYENGK